MRFLCFCLTALCAFVPASASDNPCTNGSFEELAPNEFPVDWAPVGSQVEVASEAHSGDRALRLVRIAETETRETGLNRAYNPSSENGGAMIGHRRGGIDFWYKAVSAKNAQLCVYAIPMNKERVEKTASARAQYAVPISHIGDGQWHHARLKYDFTDNAKVRWVQFAARIVGTAGDMLLDDISYVERVGVILTMGAVRLEEDPGRPGERCTIRAKIENAGDADADEVRATIKLPAALRATPDTLSLGSLEPDDVKRAVWTVDGSRTEPQTFHITAKSGDAKAETSFELLTGMAIRSFGPAAPAGAEGEPALIECVLENTGNVVVKNPVAELSLGEETAQKTVDKIPPGRSVMLQASFVPSKQSQEMKTTVKARAENVAGELTADSSLIVGAAEDLPAKTGDRMAKTDNLVLLANKHVRLAFRRNEFGFGPAELSVARRGSWRTVAWLPRLCRFVYRDADGGRVERTIAAKETPKITSAKRGRLVFQWSERSDDGAQWSGSVAFELSAGENEIAAKYEIRCDKPRDLLAFDGPMLYVLDRDEAIFPGLEWLVDDEVSSSSLDIAEDHEHRVRRVVHPNMITIPAIGIQGKGGTVGLLWDAHQRWDGQRDRPSAIFASPDRFEHQRAHLAGLFLPTVPDFVEPNATEASKPYPLKPGQSLRIEATIYADATADSPLAAIDRWVRKHGFPKPAPLPRGSYDREIQFSMQAYLSSLWVPETNEWWLTKGHGLMSKTGRPRNFAADLLVGSIVCPSAELRKRCRDRAEEVVAIIGGERRLDVVRFGRRADLAFANPGPAAQLLSSREEDGSWRFDADQQHKEGPFVGYDYYDLGPDDALEIGTCARKAYDVLRYARIAGDWEAFDKVQKTLTLMETFRVPRAAQVWEVPVHTPDVLAAADAVDAYVEAYRFSGNRRWLQDAVTWAKRGLPFIYLWEDPEKPFLVGASIPVFGATWHRGSWFGRPVQWNGLRYAGALLKLADHDKTYPWRQIAETVIRSAIHQQEPAGKDVALWPDAISAIDSKKSAWIFGPQHIMGNVLKLTGRDPEPATVIVGEGRRRIHITTTASVPRVGQLGNSLVFDVSYPSGEQGVVLISNIGRPVTVKVDDHPVPERTNIEREREPCWRYDAGNAYLSVRVNKDGRTTIRVDGGGFREVRRLPWLAENIAFEFQNSRDGWMPSNDIADLLPRSGQLVGKIAGADPYLVRSPTRVEGRVGQVLRLRMRLTAGSGGQFFWTTESSPDFDEEKSLRFAVIPDREFHEYRLPVSHHPMWAGQTITAIRLDPTGGVASGEFAVDYLRAETP